MLTPSSMQHCRSLIRVAARIPPLQQQGCARSLWDARTGLPVSGTNLGGTARSLIAEASDQGSPPSGRDTYADEAPSEKQVLSVNPRASNYRN